MRDPIQKSIDVPLSPNEAFKLFTEEIANWWPSETFSVSAERGKKPRDITFGTHKGDQIIEVTEQGEQHVWGTIEAYDPGVFLSFSWHPGKGEDQATFVKLAFEEKGSGTNVALTHGGFEVLGDLADAVSNSYLQGWDLVLGCYQQPAKVPANA